MYSGTAYARNNCGALIQKRSSKDFHHFEIAKTPKPFEKVTEMSLNPHQFQQIPMVSQVKALYIGKLSLPADVIQFSWLSIHGRVNGTN